MLDRINDIHYIGGQRSQMKLGAWQREIEFMDDTIHRDCLLEGILHTFPIVDSGNIPQYECANYNSSQEPLAKQFLSKLFKDEVFQGIIIPTTSIPHCIHAIGAVPKKDSSYRPITDCRRPISSSINNYMMTTCQPFKYNSLDMVCNRLSRGDSMCCMGIKAAYRSVSIRTEHRRFQGFR